MYVRGACGKHDPPGDVATGHRAPHWHAHGGAAPTLDLATFPDYAALVNVVAAAALVEPAVAEVADETHITLDELPFEDRLFIFNWAQGGAAALATFPGNPGPSPSLAPDSDHLRTPPKRPAPSSVA